MIKNEKANSNSVLTEIYSAYKKEPDFFVEHALGHLTWSKQREILRSVRDNQKTAVRACHGVSKTYAAAEVATWFLNCFEDSKVITTAPTFTQVRDLLWAEIGRFYRTSRIRLDGECMTVSIRTKKAEHFAIGFSTDKPQRAEGWHAPQILFIFDEAKGIPQWLWESIRGLMTGGFCRWLAISTTDGVNPGDQYEKCFKDDSGWNQIHIAAHESPYITGEKFQGIKIPDLERLDKFEPFQIDPNNITIQIANQAWIDECEKDWGKDSVLFTTKVRGEIDQGGEDTIIKLSQVMKMFDNGKLENFDDTGDIEIGVDVARGGGDDTVFFKRKGMKVIDYKIIPSKAMPTREKTEYISDELEIFADQKKKIRIKVDDTGVGGGVTDIMQRREYNIVPVNFQQKAKDETHYANAICEMWYEVAKIIEQIACPFDPNKEPVIKRLQAELVNRKKPKSPSGVIRPLDNRGRLQIESKDDYKKRGFQSPDIADAFLLCFYNVRGGIRQFHVIDTVADEDEDWERAMIERRRKRMEDPKDDHSKVRYLRTPEVARTYIEMSSNGKPMSEIARTLNCSEADLKLFISLFRHELVTLSHGGGETSGGAIII